MSSSTLELPTFESLGLRKPMLQTISALGYESPSPIQLEAIPPLLEALDYLFLHEFREFSEFYYLHAKNQNFMNFAEKVIFVKILLFRPMLKL